MKRFWNSGTGFLLILMFILNLLNGRHRNMSEYLLSILLMLPGMLVGFTFHEFGHALASCKLGDPTPKTQGRLSLNPVSHIDPYGLIALILCGFGWGKPVETDPRYYKNPRRDEFIVSIAGVTNNLILAILFSFLYKYMITSVFPNSVPGLDSTAGILLYIVFNAIAINVVLMVFNLLPIPPLDGFGIVTQIFNLTEYRWYYSLYNNGMLILIVLLIFNVVDRVLTPAVAGIINILL